MVLIDRCDSVSLQFDLEFCSRNQLDFDDVQLASTWNCVSTQNSTLRWRYSALESVSCHAPKARTHSPPVRGAIKKFCNSVW